MPLIVDGYDPKCCATCQRPFEATPESRTRTKGHTRPRRAHVIHGKAQDGPPALGYLWFKPARYPRAYVWLCWKCNHRQGNQTFRQWEHNLRLRASQPKLTKMMRHEAIALADRLVILMDALRAAGYTDNDF